MFGLKTLSLIASTFLLSGSEAKKVFIENDGLAPLQLLFPLMAGWEVVGISTSIGSSSVVDGVGQVTNILETYNLTSCIPNYIGAQNPLIRTNESFHVWEELFGELVWQGAFAPGYADMYTWDNVTYDDTPGAIAMINAVRENRDTDPVYIYSAGTLTTVAQALSIYPDLINDAAGLYIMGGYIDGQYMQAVGPSIVNDINTDINLIQDPEAAQIALTAPWKEVVIGGNVTNYLVPSQELYDIIIDRAGGYENLEDLDYFNPVLSLVATGNYTENNEQQTLPFWDEVVSAFMVWPDLAQFNISVKTAVDTQFYSPFYGSLRIWGEEFAPARAQTGNATIVTSIDDSRFYGLVVDTFFQDWRQYCEVGGPVELDISSLE